MTLRHPRNQKIEIQIRTRAMHEVADNGVAAHWTFKEGGTAPPQEVQRFGWVQDLLEILENSGAPDEFLENTKLELYQDQVFCFTPKGQLIQLPRGATPDRFRVRRAQPGRRQLRRRQNQRPPDAAAPRAAERRPGRNHDGARRHALAVMGTLGRYRKARARIRKYVQAQQRAQSIDQGRAALARAFRQDGLDGSDKVLETALSR